MSFLSTLDLDTMWDLLPVFFSAWPTAEITFWGVWVVVALLLVVGLLGTALPVIPGPVLIVVGAVVHFFFCPGSAVSWWGIALLVLLCLLSYAVDILSGAIGTKWFGGSRWAIVGVLIGGIVGLFFGLVGIIVGPLLGGFAFELLFAKKKLGPAAKSTVGTALGTTVGIAAKVVIGIIMVISFLADAFWI